MRLLLSLAMSLAVGALVVMAVMRTSERVAVVSPPAPGVIPDQPVVDTKAGIEAFLQAPVEPPTTKGYLYRWRDADGTIHIQSTPPAPEIQATIITYDKQKLAQSRDPGQDQATTPAQSSGQGRLSNPLSVYTPEGLDQLLETVDETANMLQQRNQTLDKLSQDL